MRVHGWSLKRAENALSGEKLCLAIGKTMTSGTVCAPKATDWYVKQWWRMKVVLKLNGPSHL